MDNTKNQLREDSVSFALATSDVCDSIKGCSVFVNQLLRSSSSIGANLHEAKYAQSRADFINKLEISLKECSETEYWLELLYKKTNFLKNTIKLYAISAAQFAAGLLPLLLLPRVQTADLSI